LEKNSRFFYIVIIKISYCVTHTFLYFFFCIIIFPILEHYDPLFFFHVIKL
jgi:hypothetical protein